MYSGIEPIARTIYGATRNAKGKCPNIGTNVSKIGGTPATVIAKPKLNLPFNLPYGYIACVSLEIH